MTSEELKIEIQKVLTEENIDVSTLNVEDIIKLIKSLDDEHNLRKMEAV